ncbi:hypothetical protein FLK61_37320 [Paenalkalicoccus suaedae]|uniref:Uncharacterized protein n=1 Tax=Paenalkalicoccus suaedae TaxID=2592382 RepID=A0A859FHJ3_9BACI|nr:hypothetical protein FLK61_37320 [Paenalkalicoccus suaedae]
MLITIVLILSFSLYQSQKELDHQYSRALYQTVLATDQFATYLEDSPESNSNIEIYSLTVTNATRNVYGFNSDMSERNREYRELFSDYETAFIEFQEDNVSVEQLASTVRELHTKLMEDYESQ